MGNLCLCCVTFFLTLTDTARGSERQDFLSEIELMKKVSEGHSPHVVGMLGCVTLQEPLCLVTEFVKYGDLLSYLRTTWKMVSTKNSVIYSWPTPRNA